MFCQKCGNELEENTIFCSKCGASLPVVDAEEQSTDNAVISDGLKTDETVPAIETATKAYELLQKNAALCPGVRLFVLEEYRSSAVTVGKFYRYSAQILNGQIRLTASPVFPYVIPYVLCGLGVPLVIGAADIATYFEEPVFLSLAVLFAVLSGLAGIGISALANKEKMTILSFMRKVLSQSKYIEPPLHMEIIVFSLYVFVCIVFWVIFGLLLL